MLRFVQSIIHDVQNLCDQQQLCIFKSVESGNPILNVFIVLPISLYFAKHAATTELSTPPDNKHPIGLSLINLFVTALSSVSRV